MLDFRKMASTKFITLLIIALVANTSAAPYFNVSELTASGVDGTNICPVLTHKNRKAQI